MHPNLDRAIAEARADHITVTKARFILVSKASGEWITSPCPESDERLWSVDVRNGFAVVS